MSSRTPIDDGRTPSPGNAGTGWIRRLGVQIYRGEGAVAALFFASLFLSVTFQYAAKTVRQATFVDAFGASNLPWVYLAVAVLSYPTIRLYGGLGDRLPQHRLVAWTSGAIAAGLMVFWLLFDRGWSWVPAAFYVWVSIAMALNLSQLWSYANGIFNPRQAKRLFGFLGAGALLGGIAGGQVARLATLWGDTRDSLFAAAVLLATVSFLVLRIRRLRPAPVSTPGVEPRNRVASSGFAAIRESRYLQLITALMVLSVMVSQVVDLQFNWAVERSTESLEQRTLFFGNFFSAMGLVAFVFQLVFTSRIHRVMGVGFAIRVLPLTVAAGTVALFVTAALFPPGLVVAALLLKASDSGLRYSLDDSTRELLFLPVSERKRVRAKAVIDVFVKRGAKGLAALLLLPVTFGLASELQTGWISLLLVTLWLALTVVLAREYVRSFRLGLKRKSVDASIAINLSDVTTLEILVQALGSVDPRQVLHSLDLLATHGRGNLVPPVLLFHEDPEVRRRTLQILAEERREDAAPLIEKRLSDDHPEVRAEATRVLAELRHQDACEMMLPRLESADPGVRAAAISCLSNHGDPEMALRAATALRDMLGDADPAVRAEAAKAIGAVAEPTHAELLVQLLYDPEVSTVREAIHAVSRRVTRDRPNPLYGPTLISLLQNRPLKHEAREALVAFGEPMIPALLHFMNDPDEPVWVRRAIPKTIARIGTVTASNTLLSGLGGRDDPFLRRKLIEALGSSNLDRPQSGSAKLQAQVRQEVRAYLEVLSDIATIDRPAAKAVDSRVRPAHDELGSEDLLTRLLAEKLENHRFNLFGLLALLYGRGHIWDAYHGLRSSRTSVRAHALEYLDNTLTGDDRRWVFTALGDQPMDEKLAEARREWGLGGSKLDTVRRYLQGAETASFEASFYVVASLYLAHTEDLRELAGEVETLSLGARDPFVSETGRWVLRRFGRLSEEGPKVRPSTTHDA